MRMILVFLRHPVVQSSIWGAPAVERHSQNPNGVARCQPLNLPTFYKGVCVF